MENVGDATGADAVLELRMSDRKVGPTSSAREVRELDEDDKMDNEMEDETKDKRDFTFEDSYEDGVQGYYLQEFIIYEKNSNSLIIDYESCDY